MIVRRQVTADEVWCEFLRAEYRYRMSQGLWAECERLTTAPDFTDPLANARRKLLIRSIRSPMVDPVPTDTTWHLVELTQEECSRIRTCAYKSWILVTNGTSRLVKAAENTSKEDWVPPAGLRTAFGALFDHTMEEVAGIKSKVRAIVAGGSVQGTPILVRQEESDEMTIIEGAHRLTALAILEEFFTQSGPGIDVYLGTSKNMSSNHWLGAKLAPG